MSVIPPTFDEFWHRVAPRQVRLRPGVDIFAQRFRGQRWYVVRDALSGKFFRLRPAAYEFICELERSATVGDAWQRRLEIDPENVPGQGEVIRLLSSLHRSGLLRSDMEGDVEPLAEAFADEKRQEAKQRWSSILFFKMPLWNPDAFLRRTLPWVSWIFTKPGLVAWLVLLMWAGSEVASQWKAFVADTSGILGLSNLPWMLVTMVMIKLLHELGHGYACRKLGGEVPETGVMLLLFNPLPYVDVSSSSAFRSKWQRMFVGGAGMIVELAVAAIAALVWAHTGQGIVHTLAHNAVILASVVTLMFNGNPLLRYDGYHILSDWLELPNLQLNSSRMALYWLERYGFGIPTATNPADTKREACWFTGYFIASFIYRTLILLGILLMISLHYLAFGVLLAVIFSFMWIVMPVIKAIIYLWSSPKLDACRQRALGVSVGLLVGVLGFLCLVPMPSHFRAEGVVKAQQFSRVYAKADGRLTQVLVPSGTMVVEGTPLLQMVGEDLEQEFELLDAEQSRAEAQARLALDEDPVRYESLKAYFQALAIRRSRLMDDAVSLVVRAPCDGRWLAPDANLYMGDVLSRGLELGLVQGEDEFYLSAIVQQDDVSRIFTKEQVNKTEVRVRGQEGIAVGVRDFTALPAERESLPSAALGLQGGGNAAVDMNQSRDGRPIASRGLTNSEQGTKAKQPVFEVRATIDSDSESALQLVHGQRAVARMTLPAEPLMWQWVRAIRQLFQRTYQI